MNHRKFLLNLRPAFLASFIKKLIMVERQIVSTPIGKFYVDPISNFGNSILTDNTYENDLVEVIRNILRPGDSFIDLGANEGFFSILASKIVGADGKVYAIEPQTRLQEILFRNVTENDAFNVNVIQRAISNKDGLVKIELAPDVNTGSSGLSKSTKYNNPVQPVLQITFNRLISQLNIKRIKLIKIDIEGFEYEAILGSKGIFQENIIENIALELHPKILEKRGKSTSEILEFLKEAGYKENIKFSNLVFTKESMV